MRSGCLFLFFLVACPYVSAQEVQLPEADYGDESGMSRAMAELAQQGIAVYKEDNEDRYLNTLFRLQAVAGQHAEAESTLGRLRKLRQANNPGQVARLVPFEVLLKAKRKQATEGLSFDKAFAEAFRELHGRFDDRTAFETFYWFEASLARAENDLRNAFDQQKGKDQIALSDALTLIRRYYFYHAYKEILPLAAVLIEEDDARRYVIEDNVSIKTPEGVTICAMLVRPRSATRLPTLLGFTIYAKPEWSLIDARLTAARGYAGVVAYTRGKACSPETPIPYEHDGDDARAVIDWISQQPWSDGRVGMYGGSYNGFAQWAAAKRMPAALKAIMPIVAVAPGIDVPMEGNVFLNFVYPWPFFTTTTNTLNETVYSDRARWDKLYQDWYSSGKPYRLLDQIDGTPNPIFLRWLDHPSYDDYWQKMIPYGEEFANIDIPVLTVDGYFQGGALSSVYYFTQHLEHNPRAEHYYVVGPYGHFGAQRRPEAVLDGYAIDPVARLDMEGLRYEWFDYVFRGAPKPALLRDKVNYQVMGTNEWKHAPSVEAMSNAVLRLHLTSDRTGDTYRLRQRQKASRAFISQEVDFAVRDDGNQETSELIIRKTLDSQNGIVFVSDPLQQPTEFSGLFSGRLDFVANKRDMDLTLSFYELLPNGEYFQLSSYTMRASYVKNRSRRHLLTPGRRERLRFRSGRLTSRQLQSGSRLVLVVTVNKSPYLQINYGTGKDVSDESIADAKAPLRIKWYSTSYVDIPVWR